MFVDRSAMSRSKPKLREMPWSPWMAACDISRRMIALAAHGDGSLVESRIRPIAENPEAHALVSCNLHGWAPIAVEQWSGDYPGVFIEASSCTLLYLYPGSHMRPSCPSC